MAKILVINDDKGMRQVITKILSPRGHTLLETEEGLKAIEICRKEKPDIAISDIRLPDIGGAEILKELKSINPDIPLIIITGFSDIETAVELVQQGCFDYISKPFKIDDFTAMVKKALSKTPAGAEIDQEKPKAGEHQPQSATAVITPGKRKRRAIVYGSVISLILAAAGIILFNSIDNSLPEAEFSIPYSNPAALSWDGKYLWAADWVSAVIYQHVPDKMSVVNIFKSSDTAPVGLAVGGGNVWTCDTFERIIYKYNFRSIPVLTASYKSPGPSPAGLYYDGTNLWSIDFQQNRIYKHAVDSELSVAGSYESPAVNTRAMFGYKGYFYIADAKTNRIFKVRKETFSVAGVYSLGRFEGAKDHISGMAWDGKSVWVCADDVQKIFRFPLKSLKPVK